MRLPLFVGIVLVFAVVLGLAWLRSGPPSMMQKIPTAEFPALGFDDHILGAQGAPIQMFVYMDLDCSYCKDFHTTTLPQLLKTYGNELLVIYREFPLASHPDAYHKAEAAECAYAQGGNTVFFDFVDHMYRAMSASGTYGTTILFDTARTIGLNMHTFESCLETGQEKKKVNQNIVEGTIVGVGQVPSVLLKRGDTTVLVSGNYLGQMQAAVQYLLAR